MITRLLPCMEPALQRVQGLLIATHIGNVAVGMSRDREAKALAFQEDAEKGVPDLVGSNLTYLLRLIYVAAHEYLPTV